MAKTQINQVVTEEMKKHFREYHGIPANGITFGTVAKNNLLATTKVFGGKLFRYITCISGDNRFATIDMNV